MNEDTKTAAVLTGVAIMFAALAVGFITGAWDPKRPSDPLVMVDPIWIDASPVRMNFAALEAADEDTSDYSCYACHNRNERVQLKFDELGEMIIEEHDYINFRHGPTHENNYCFNCHNPDKMDELRTPFRKLSFAESNLLCGSCHGTQYRDWEAGAHGRTSGYWNLNMGERARLDCTQCHDPHDTRFPAIKPAPGPHSLEGRILIDRKTLEPQ
jgi:uncharacterized CHY-type Zn-finger protein